LLVHVCHSPVQRTKNGGKRDWEDRKKQAIANQSHSNWR